MKHAHTLLTIIWMGLLSLLLVACGQPQSDEIPPQAETGVLDLQKWTVDEAALLPLEGEWAFYWQQLLLLDELGETAVTDYVPVPDNWQDYTVNGEPLPAEGYATFHLQLQNLDPDKIHGLYLDGQSMAFKLWLDGELLAQVGQVGTSKSEMEPQKKPQVVFFQPDSGNVELVMQISNYYHQKSGFRNALLLGDAQSVIQHQARQLFSTTLLFGILMIMGLYHIFLYAFRPQTKAALYFGLLCWLTAVRISVTNQRIILDVFPNLRWEFMFRLEYLTFFLVFPVFIQFLYNLYPQDVPKRFTRIVWGIGFSFSLLLLWPSTLQLSNLTTPYQVVIVIELIYFAYLLALILHRRREDGWLVALAGGIGIAAILVDILYYQEFISVGEVTPYGFLGFIFVQAILLSHRFSKSFQDVENLSVALEGQNVLLAQNEKKYRAIFEESNDLILVAKPDGTIIDVNSACETVLGFSRQEALQMNTSQAYVNMNDLDYVRHAILNNGKLKDYELKLQRKDGQQIDAIVSSALRYYDDGSVMGVQSVVRDITDRKQAEREHLKNIELKKEKQVAEAASEAKSDFLANMSHEFRTPLNGILGYAQILQRDGSLTTVQRDGLTTIYNSGHHLLTLINDVLDLAKIEARRLEVHPSALALPIFLHEIVDMMHMAAQQKHLNLRFIEEDSLPAVIKADDKRLRQVLLNLLGNAVKFTERGSVSFRVMVVPSPSPHPNPLPEGEGTDSSPLGEGLGWGNDPNLCRLRFEVQDTGVGIEPDQLDMIFQPFEQVGDVQHRAEGTGLGLAISQQLVELMGGKIELTSKVGEGSLFAFEADFVVIEETAVISQSTPSQQIVGYEGERRRILVVDDRLENRRVLLSLLEPLGFTICLAENGREAIRKMREFEPDLIFMDLLMPVMMGVEAVSTIRKMPSYAHLPIIAISASTLDIDRESSQSIGCDDFLMKPVEVDKLFDVLQSHLELTWQRGSLPDSISRTMPSQVNPDNDNENIVAPSQDELEIMLELARFGNMDKLQERAHYLEELSPKYQLFAQKLIHLSVNYEDEQILTFVTGYLTPEE